MNRLALDFARKGAGTDLRSPIGQGLAMLRKPQSHEMMLLRGRSGARKGSIEKSLAITGTRKQSIEETEGDQDDTAVARRASADDIALQEPAPFAPLLADWQFRRWNISDSHEFTSYFKNWMEGVAASEGNSHAPRLEDQERFLEGELHLNPESETGVEPQALEYPATSYDTSDKVGAPHLHETSLGYMYNWQDNVKGKESFCASIDTRLSQTPQPDISPYLTLPVREDPPEEETSPPLTNPNIYLRPVENKDVPHVMDIYNWYIRNSVLCTEIDTQEEGDIILRIDMCKKEKLPFIVAAQRKPGAVHAGNSTDEVIEGFVYATDFSGQRTVHGQTSQLEVYVRNGMQRKAIGKCLMDKLLSLCDHKYSGDCRYDFDCGPPDRNLYCGSGLRDLRRLVVVIQFVPDGQSDFEQWLRRWLEAYGFKVQGMLEGVAVNHGQE